jgi:hypothetical protein
MSIPYNNGMSMPGLPKNEGIRVFFPVSPMRASSLRSCSGVDRLTNDINGQVARLIIPQEFAPVVRGSDLDDVSPLCVAPACLVDDKLTNLALGLLAAEICNARDSLWTYK